MDKKTNYYFLAILVALFFTACTSNEDKMKIAFYDQYFSKQKGAALDKPVDSKVALACVNLYNFKRERVKFYRVGEIKDMMKTDAVGFKLDSLKKWLESLDVNEVDAIRIRFGAYTPEAIDNEHRAKDLENRLTVFLWPYYKGEMAKKSRVRTNQDGSELINPYNIGTLYP
ncbi:MAG: hypothetical protein IE931_00405 [Sphingobacteriales bacterium]|nr:hypothetical protein [Sphingobacteriales bacterium]